MDNQIAQLSSTLRIRQQGALPLKPIQPTDHANAIILKSGSHYDGPPMTKDDEPVTNKTANVDSVKLKTIGKNQDRSGDVQSPMIQLPFPNRHIKNKLDKKFGKFLEVVKNLQVTVPSTDLITQVLAYSKFIKDILTRKRVFNEVETVAFTEECSALRQNKSPPKLKDLGSFSISCHIGNIIIDKALCDLDMDEDTQIPIILGRPFIHTTGAIIDVKNGKLTLSARDDNITFNLGRVMKGPMLEEKYYSDTNIWSKDVDEIERALSNEQLSPDENDKVEILIQESYSAEVKKPELKPLPSHLKYVFLDEQELHPVIISTALDDP
ncbi:uncharacterized protein LOC110682930 [Chenopodium quinoa]|uniref:uncharacterized protein LOC110682930 n=1 Tax=Chenopodium quinoa TaxID=63459 RepID=UPI000B776BDC|nr:uncharacterized protein LOC110682930 [Chenopodium quinoa]